MDVAEKIRKFKEQVKSKESNHLPSAETRTQLPPDKIPSMRAKKPEVTKQTVPHTSQNSGIFKRGRKSSGMKGLFY